MWILYIFLTQFGLFGVQSLKIHITIDNKTVFKYGSSERQTLDSDLNLTKPSHDVPGRRFKREIPAESFTGEDENGPCKGEFNRHGRPMRNVTFHQALVVDKNTRVSLICHYCNDSDAVVYGSILWYRVSRSISSQVSVTEVIPDMHDEEDRNLVVISPAHTLTFKSAVPADAGGYFCLSEDNSTILDSIGFKTNASSALTKLLSVPGQVRFFYHLDVLPPIGLKIRQVSLYGHGHPKPQKKIIIASRNLVFYTDWQEWTRCSTCGNVGERKRYGVRMIAKNDQNNVSSPWYLDKVLRTFTKGVPCRSTLLKEVKDLPETSDEIDTELCDVACHRKWIYSDSDVIKPKITNERWRDLKFDTKHKVLQFLHHNLRFLTEIEPPRISEELIQSSSCDMRLKTEVIRKFLVAKAGDVFKMKCQGASVDSMVWWKNGTTSLNSFTLSETSLGRVRIDSLNNLIIRPVSLYDAGKYSCWINGKLWALVKLNVHAVTPKQIEGVWYHAPYLCTVLSFHLWVFLSTLLLRHAYRLGSAGDKADRERRSSTERGKHVRFWLTPLGRNDGEEERQRRIRLEKYGDSHTRMVVSGGTVCNAGGEAEEERRSLIKPSKDVWKMEQDEMPHRRN